MNGEKKNFDAEATQWDESPEKVKLANDVADAISVEVELTPDMQVLDFGCGTGLITLRIQSKVQGVTGIDSSQKMLDVLAKKIEKLGLRNVKLKCLDLAENGILNEKYQLVVSSMVLHHIKEIGPLFEQFYESLTTFGCLCIADLETDNGQFHENSQGVFHAGFNRAELRKFFVEAGFDNVTDRTAAEISKPNSADENQKFTVFVMTGRKLLR